MRHHGGLLHIHQAKLVGALYLKTTSLVHLGEDHDNHPGEGRYPVFCRDLSTCAHYVTRVVAVARDVEIPVNEEVSAGVSVQHWNFIELNSCQEFRGEI